jgi:hypothetical protein
VVATDVGGQAELVTPDCGVLVKPTDGDEDGLALRFAQVLSDLLRDPVKRTRFGELARKRVEEHFQIDQMGKTMLAYFDLAAHNHQTQRVQINPAHAKIFASNAIEYIRMERESEGLWKQVVELNKKSQILESKCEELSILADHNFRIMPPASPTAYFYFGIRAIFLPIYQKVENLSPNMRRVKDKIKNIFISEKSA